MQCQPVPFNRLFINVIIDKEPRREWRCSGVIWRVETVMGSTPEGLRARGVFLTQLGGCESCGSEQSCLFCCVSDLRESTDVVFL